MIDGTEIVAPRIEHPDDWKLDRGTFAKECSQLGYCLLTMADATQGREATEEELRMFASMKSTLQNFSHWFGNLTPRGDETT